MTARDGAAQQYLMARVYAANGKADTALTLLRSAKDAGFADWQRVTGDAEFKSLLEVPRFVGLVARTARS